MQTDELLKILNGTQTTEQLHQLIANTPAITQQTLVEYLVKQMKSKQLKKSEVIQNAQIDRVYGYQILQGKRTPSRDVLLCLCIATKLTLYEIQQALAICRHGRLYPKNKRDAVLIYGINQNYSVMQVNDLLFEANEAILCE